MAENVKKIDLTLKNDLEWFNENQNFTVNIITGKFHAKIERINLDVLVNIILEILPQESMLKLVIFWPKQEASRPESSAV